MCAIGSAGFNDFLTGFRLVDDHFRTAPLSENAPAIAGLLGIWYRNFWGWQTHAVLPYSQALDRFSAYLQQLDMESNGKRINLDGEPVDVDTAPILWGRTRHQWPAPRSINCCIRGPRRCHVTLLVSSNLNLATSTEPVRSTIIDCCSPTWWPSPRHWHSAEPAPRSALQVSLLSWWPHRTFPGNRPSTVITAPALTASVLGQLIAFYEHRVFTQGIVWGVNSFDQWGVELGKVLATAIGTELDGQVNPEAHDSSTNALISLFLNQ